MKSWWKRLTGNWKGLSRKKKVIWIIAIVLVLLLAGSALAYHFWYNKPRQKVTIDPQTGDVIVTKDDSVPDLNGKVNILLIGIDERKNTQDKTYRTDTLILASIDPQSKRIALLSIPRDTRVQIPKHGWDKINAAAAYGGLNMTVAVVQELTGVTINGYVKTNFDGFKDVIDTLGGITVDVEKNMYYETGDKVDGIINLKKGVQVLDGTKALEYARFRHDALADISRTARQQVVLKAIAKKMLEPATIPKIPALIMEFSKAVDTNLPVSDLVNIGRVAAKFDNSNMISQTLPGYFLNLDGISYWGVDPDQAKKIAAQLFDQGVAIGNSSDKLIQASNNGPVTGSSTKPAPPSASVVPTISIGHLTTAGRSANSITLSVTASSGVDAAELYRNGQPIHGWAGGAITFTDKGLKPNTNYTYQIKVFRDGNVLQASSPYSIRTLQEQTTTTPPTTTQPQEVPPKLEVTSPSNGTVEAGSLTVGGNTDANSSVEITVKDKNGTVKRTVTSDANGNFSCSLNLSEGYNTITIQVTNPKTGLSSNAVTRTVNYQPSTTTSQTAP